MGDLIHRIETAPEPRRELFEEAFDALHPDFNIADLDCASLDWRFSQMLDAQAWTSAAEMLVPDGWLWSIEPSHHAAHWFAEVWIEDRDGSEASSNTAHPSLALLAAILKANGYE